ncbi:hypothetical protein LP105_03110 [Moraxella bovis]|uniref:hypothetical protein n=1 Tax=Moraxella bovis TaxID=476 RepID=UPI0022263A91|nr:hypothetical protein [Moraxella bovis]UYZ73717.1 hypothetical protein LP105_03110 [Moraxella bovis]
MSKTYDEKGNELVAQTPQVPKSIYLLINQRQNLFLIHLNQLLTYTPMGYIMHVK